MREMEDTPAYPRPYARNVANLVTNLAPHRGNRAGRNPLVSGRPDPGRKSRRRSLPSGRIEVAGCQEGLEAWR